MCRMAIWQLYIAPDRLDGRDRERVYFGTSSAGLREKKPAGTSLKPAWVAGITGHSSGRGMWVMPIVYQTTTSASTRRSLSAVHFVSPSPPRLWFGYRPP